MKMVIQRVSKAEVRVNEQVVGSIGLGLLALSLGGMVWSRSGKERAEQIAANTNTTRITDLEEEERRFRMPYAR